MNLVSIRIITDKFAQLVSFYEHISGLPATRYGDVFAELSTPTCTLAIGSTQTLQAFHAGGVLYPAQNRSVIIEFLVKEVDKDFVRLKEHVTEFVQEPTTMPWGNRSLLFHDPDGNLVNLFTPITPEAVKRFQSKPGERWP
jgi:predicted enzyme related to lactoylglutathione lyase